jgi:hypothetical protein
MGWDGNRRVQRFDIAKCNITEGPWRKEEIRPMNKSLVKIPLERIEEIILLIRGEKVILDSDLARLYGVSTSRFNERVKRNSSRFPTDFCSG